MIPLSDRAMQASFFPAVKLGEMSRRYWQHLIHSGLVVTNLCTAPDLSVERNSDELAQNKFVKLEQFDVALMATPARKGLRDESLALGRIVDGTHALLDRLSFVWRWCLPNRRMLHRLLWRRWLWKLR